MAAEPDQHAGNTASQTPQETRHIAHHYTAHWAGPKNQRNIVQEERKKGEKARRIRISERGKGAAEYNNRRGRGRGLV
jgi:hypothetical protein